MTGAGLFLVVWFVGAAPTIESVADAGACWARYEAIRKESARRITLHACLTEGAVYRLFFAGATTEARR